jgi:hypothetical protein
LVVVVGAAVVGGALVVGATVVVGASVVGAAVVGGLVEVTPSAACARSSPPVEQAPRTSAAASPNETTAAAPCLVRVTFSHLRVVGCCRWFQWYQSDRAHAVAGM